MQLQRRLGPAMKARYVSPPNRSRMLSNVESRWGVGSFVCVRGEVPFLGVVVFESAAFGRARR